MTFEEVTVVVNIFTAMISSFTFVLVIMLRDDVEELKRRSNR